MDHQVAIIDQDPIRLVIAFDASRQLARPLLEIEPHLVGDGLNLALVGAGDDHEIIGERRDPGEIENRDIGGLLGFRGADGDEPGRGGGFEGGGFARVYLGQNTLLSVFYRFRTSNSTGRASALTSGE